MGPAGQSADSAALSVAWRHPFATVEVAEVSGQRRRITTLDPGLGASDAASRQTGALNRVLSSLADPRIVRAETVEQVEGRMRLTSQFTDARPVGEELSKGPLPLRRALHIVLEVSRILDAAHGLGVIHGAVTPGCVLVAGGGDAPSVQITDFGLGHVVSGTEHGAGAPQWHPFAPEKLLGERPVPATDVYLVGALAYALLTGRPVFEGDSFEVAQRSHSIEEPPVLHELEQEPPIPKMLSLVLLRCLVKEPEDRYAGPGELVAALSAYVRQLGPAASASDGAASQSAAPAAFPSAPQVADDDDDDPATLLMELRPPPGKVDPKPMPGPMPTPMDAPTDAPTAFEEPVEGSSSKAWILAVVLVVFAAVAGAAYVYAAGYLPMDPAPTEAPAAVEAPSAAEPTKEQPTESKAEPSEPRKKRAAAKDEPAEPEEEAPATDGSPQGEPEGEQAVVPAGASEIVPDPEADELDEELPPEDAAQFLEEEGKPAGKRATETRKEARSLVIEAAAARRAGRYDEAQKLFEQALETHANYAPAAHGLAGIHYRRGDFKEAVRYGQMAVASAKRSPDYHVRLGDAYRELMNYKKARYHWRRASKLGSAKADERLAR